MGKGQRGYRKVWGEMSGRGDLERCGRSRVEEKELEVRKAPRERMEV